MVNHERTVGQVPHCNFAVVIADCCQRPHGGRGCSPDSNQIPNPTTSSPTRVRASTTAATLSSPRTHTGYVDGVVVQRQRSRRRVAARLASLPGRRPRHQPRPQVPTRTRTLVHVRPRRQTRRAGQSPTKHAEGTHHDDKCAPANGNDTRLRQRQNNRRHGTTKTATMLRTRLNAFSAAQ